MAISINIENVSKNFGEINALDDISVNIQESELFGFIGPDGAGKTTLFRLITTLMLPSSGKVMVEGLDSVKDYKKIRQLLGYMPGRFSLYHDLSVEENLKFYATIFGTTIEDNYDLIKSIYVQIEPFKKRLAGNLSGGMKQKLALSCALIHKPKVLILDEPTTGVDAVSRVEFWDMLHELKLKGITILVSTPYMDEASRCDRVALMQKGKIMKTDTPEGIINSFEKTLYSIKTQNIYKLLNDLKNYKNTHSAFAFGQDVHWIGDETADLELLKYYLNEKEQRDYKIEMIKPNIEDCFMELMQDGGEPRAKSN